VARNSATWWLRLAMWPVPGWRWFPSLVYWFGRYSMATQGKAPGEPGTGVSKGEFKSWRRGRAPGSVSRGLQAPC